MSQLLAMSRKHCKSRAGLERWSHCLQLAGFCREGFQKFILRTEMPVPMFRSDSSPPEHQAPKHHSRICYNLVNMMYKYGTLQYSMESIQYNTVQ